MLEFKISGTLMGVQAAITCGGTAFVVIAQGGGDTRRPEFTEASRLYVAQLATALPLSELGASRAQAVLEFREVSAQFKTDGTMPFGGGYSERALMPVRGARHGLELLMPGDESASLVCFHGSSRAHHEGVAWQPSGEDPATRAIGSPLEDWFKSRYPTCNGHFEHHGRVLVLHTTAVRRSRTTAN